MTFNLAYILAVAANILLISAYTRSVLKNNLQTLIILGILVILYGYLYVVLQLQDYALLMGSVGLFVVLAILMFLTRKIDWFSILKTSDSNHSQ
jgi:inner membrane protein